MRRRVVREFITLVGVVVILGVIVAINSEMRRGSLADQMNAARVDVESKRAKDGTELLAWKDLRKTTSSKSSGQKFDEKILKQDGKTVNLVGFMTPLYEFRAMKEFMLLPLPIQCYFCQSPPKREVILVRMKEGTTTDPVNEPTLISGTLKLNQESGGKFYYTVENAAKGAAKPGERQTIKTVSQQHKEEAIANQHVEQMQEEPLQKGQEPPKPVAQ